MSENKRRAPRLDSVLPVTLVLYDDRESRALSEPVPAEILDMSVYGVRITVSRVRIGGHHLFYSFNDSPHHFIQICFTEGEQEKGVIPSYPVWFDHLVNMAGQPFQLGMEFLVEPQDENVRRLGEVIHQIKKQRGGWLKALFK